MPPPVAVSRDVPAPDLPATGHPATAPDSHVPSTSLAHVAALVREAVPPMHPGGRPVVAAVAVAAGLARLVTGRGALVGGLVTAATAAFFRNPRRVPPARTGVVLAAADGTVALVSEVVPPPELDLPRVPAPRVSVFLSVLDVHVNRMPVAGRVTDYFVVDGGYANAMTAAAEHNVAAYTVLDTDHGTVAVAQRTGLIARRIVQRAPIGTLVARGERLGLIRFGSRTDVYLPADRAEAVVAVGDKVIGASSVIARWK